MQRIETVVTEPKSIVKFLAEDGREFAKERECFEYEFAIKRKRVDAQVETKAELDDLPPFDGGENYESHEYKWYKPKTKNDLELLRSAYGNKFDDCYIGQWVCVEICDDGECWTMPLSNCIDYVNRILSCMGYEISIKPKEAHE